MSLIESEGIRIDILKLKFPQYVLETAIKVYKMLDLQIIPRGDRRKKIICHCIHQALIKTGSTNVSVLELSTKICMSKSFVVIAINNPPKYKKSFYSVSDFCTHEDMLDNIIKNYTYISNNVAVLMKDCMNTILEQNASLRHINMNVFITSFIYYYSKYKNINIDKNNLFIALGVTKSVTLKYSSDIELALVEIL